MTDGEEGECQQEGADTLLFTLSTTDCMPYMEYHPHPPSDTFLHVRKYREIMFPGERNAVSGGVRSPSECRFECFAVRNSQSRAAE